MGELSVPRVSVFKRVGCPTTVTFHPADRTLSVASSSNNPRPLTLHRCPTNHKPQRGGFYQVEHEHRRRNSWVEPERELSWKETDPAPRWRKDEWIEPPRQPLRDRHPKVEELIRLLSPRLEPRVEYRPVNLRPVFPVQGRGLGEEARVRLSTSPLTGKVLEIIFPPSWRAPKMPKFEGNTNLVIHLVEFQAAMALNDSVD